MILGIEKELSVFIQAILAGNMLYLAYMALHIWRKLIRHGRVWIAVEDLVYWGAASIFTFAQIQKTCSGNIRWYFVLGMAGGSLICYKILSKIGRKPID